MLLSLLLAGALLPASQARAAGTGDTLGTNQSLLAGESVVSSSRAFTLVMQGDGNLVVYGPSGATWAAGSNGPDRRLVMQGDGNLVIYGPAGAVWNTGTGGDGGSRLVMQDDGNLVVYRSNGSAAWHPLTWLDHMTAGGTLSGAQGQGLTSHNGAYRLVMQSDGNLVVYGPGGALWATSTNGGSDRTLVMQDDGNLVVYGSGRALWAASSNGGNDRTVVMQDDGNLVVYASGRAVWSSFGGLTSRPPAVANDGYPGATAADCSSTFGVYSWCYDTNGNGRYDGTEWMSARGFAYRNCTDYVSWKIGLNWSQINSGGDGNARGWQAGWIARGRGHGAPKVGAIAWWGSSFGSGLGHVALVTAVNADGSVQVQEYNQTGQGTYATRSSVGAQDYLYV